MTRNSRRAAWLLAACAAIPGVGAADDASARQWQFDVALDGKPIGVHTFELRPEGQSQVLSTRAEFDVKFLFITAFRYRHENTEVWQDGCLASIDASTDSNGTRLDVRGSLADGRFDLASTEGSEALPGCVRTFAYWNPAILESGKLLNSQTGAYEDVTVSLEGTEPVEVAGAVIDARRYRLSAETGDITLWYSSADGTWVGLEAPAKGGRKLSYRAIAVPEPDASRGLVARND